MEIFKHNFYLEIKISSRGKIHTVKSEAMVKEIIMVIYEMGFYDKKYHRLGDDNSTSAYITTYNDQKRKVKVATSGKEDPQKKTEDNDNVIQEEDDKK